MANVAINVEVRSNGEVVLGKLGTALDTTGKKADALNSKVSTTTSRMGEFSGAAARTSTTLARSADAFGLNASALRSLNDVMDVAELGFQNMNKAVAGFNAASLGAAGAGLAIGTVIGKWLRDIPAVAKAADQAAVSLYRLFSSQATLDAQRNATRGLKEFSAQIAAINAEAVKKQAAAMRAGGASEKDLAKFYKGTAAAEVLGLTPKDMEKKAEAERKAKEYQQDMLALTKRYNEALVSVVKNRRDEARELDGLDELSRDILETTEKANSLMLSGKRGTRLRGGDMLPSVGGSGFWTRFQDALDNEMEIAARTDDIIEQTFEWQDALGGVLAYASMIGDAFGESAGQMAYAVGMLGQVDWKAKNEKGGWLTSEKQQAMGAAGDALGGYLQGSAMDGDPYLRGKGASRKYVTGSAMKGAGQGMQYGGPIGAAIGFGIGIFTGNKEKERLRKQYKKDLDAMMEGLESQYGGRGAMRAYGDKYGVDFKAALQKAGHHTGSMEDITKAVAELEKRVAGMRSAAEGVVTVIDNMTYTNAAGEIVNTFSDPKTAEAAAGLFGATFWAVFQREGIAGIEGLKPAWDKMHQQLVKLGLDPAAMGLGRIGQMFDITSDPKTKALLGVSQGAGQLLRGAMDAGYVDTGFLADSTTLARQTLAELKGQGLDSNLAAQSMTDQLVALAQAYAATGQEMPDDLRAAMEAAGIEVLPTQLEVMKESRDYLKQIAGAAGYADGGIVRGPRLVRVGESGPEAIVPLNRSGSLTGRPVSVTIARTIGTTRETERAFDRRVERTMRRLLRQDSTLQYDTRVAVNGGR